MDNLDMMLLEMETEYRKKFTIWNDTQVSKISPTLHVDLKLSIGERIKWFIRQHRQRRSASRNTEANFEGCAYYQLPTEIQLEIAQYLEGPDLLSYAHSSRTFTFLAKNKWQQRPARSPFTTRLRIDRAHRIAQFKGIENVAWCSFHKTLHHNALFAPKQLARSDGQNRICIGAFGRFRVCEHLTLDAWGLYYDANHGLTHPPIQNQVCEPVFRLLETHSGTTALCEISHPIFTLPLHAEITERDFRTRMQNSDLHICPHLRTSQERVCELLVSLCRIEKKGHDQKVFLGPGELCEVTTSCGLCGAEITLRRGCDGNLSIGIRREIYDVWNPLSVDVLVNLEDCGLVCCSWWHWYGACAWDLCKKRIAEMVARAVGQ